VDPQWPKTSKRGLLGSSADFRDPSLVSIANFQTVSLRTWVNKGKWEAGALYSKSPILRCRLLLSRHGEALANKGRF
jgi:hypothetical protein